MLSSVGVLCVLHTSPIVLPHPSKPREAPTPPPGPYTTRQPVTAATDESAGRCRRPSLALLPIGNPNQQRKALTMDTGEFVAIDVPEDELRRIANENRQRAETLATELDRHARTTHSIHHRSTGKSFEECPFTSCHHARWVLEGGVPLGV